ncbi:MAG: dynamin family protein [Desulfobacterales bacterium]|nr:dynamin family protein [Desulfobacterales bacterium]
METYNNLKDELLDINLKLKVILAEAKNIPAAEGVISEWDKICSRIEKQIAEDLVRVAIIGPIKSGKSTFSNSLFKGDYLKRGAGVITSIVTRVKQNENLKATLYFKSWDEINEDIQQALVLFPSMTPPGEGGHFDIRREQDRTLLESALDNLSPDQLITNDTRNINSLLLSSYLKKYDEIKDHISTETEICHFDENSFAEHRKFVGDDTMAVYLKDVQLEISTGEIPSDVEIADCQGSDSPNPMHLAMIQDYLQKAHLLVYVISSRTGLRQADIRFLTMIREMGIIENIMFVVNSDFSEHDSLEDLNRLVEKVREELLIILSDPEIFVISALYNLFGIIQDELSKKDILRYAQWQAETELVSLSDSESVRFESELTHKLTDERYLLYIRNHIERLDVIRSNLSEWADMNLQLLTGDKDNAGHMLKKIKHRQERMAQIRSMIKSTLDGSIHQIKREINKDIDHFFSDKNGDIVNELIRFTRNYSVAYDIYEDSLNKSGFTNTLYQVFQEFKQAVDGFMASSVNPKVIKFVREREIRIDDYFKSTAGPYEAMVMDALDNGFFLPGEETAESTRFKRNKDRFPDCEVIRRLTGLSMPKSQSTMRYSAKIKTDAVLHLGLNAALRFMKKILKKPVEGRSKGEKAALENGVKQMKRETERSIIENFTDYRENIKFQYLYKLIDALSSGINESLLDRYRVYDADLSAMLNQLGEKTSAKEQVISTLTELIKQTEMIDGNIEALRKKLDATA